MKVELGPTVDINEITKEEKVESVREWYMTLGRIISEITGRQITLDVQIALSVIAQLFADRRETANTDEERVELREIYETVLAEKREIHAEYMAREEMKNEIRSFGGNSLN